MERRLPAMFVMLLAWGAGDAAGAAARVRLELVWFDPLNALPCPFERLSAAVDEVFRGSAVEVAWSRGGRDTVSGPGAVHVILLGGEPARVREETMGLVLRDNASRAAWIFLGNVKRALGVGSRPTPWEARDLARALGRVIAHEAVHAVVPRLPHAGHGLMAATLARPALLQPLLALDTLSARALRAALSGGTAPAYAGGGEVDAGAPAL